MKRIAELWTDRDGRTSLGRVAFWFVLFAALWRYVHTGEIGTDAVSLMGLLLGYGGVKKWVASQKGGLSA